MNKFASLLAVTLLLTSSFAKAETDSVEDLRYCLDLPSDKQIAVCAGEISPDKKGRPYSKEEVQRILSEEKANTPTSASDSSGTPATAVDKPDKDPAPEKPASNRN